MSGFANVKSLVEAELCGQSSFYTWRKTPSVVTTSGIWFDLSMSPGNPVPQYYIGSIGVATPMKLSTDGGLYHRKDVSPAKKYLREFTLLATSATPLPMAVELCDYLLFYPFIDEGTTDPQTLDNTLPLPRYTDGANVMIMAVSVAGRSGTGTFIVNYTNQDGVAGRTTPTITENTVTSNGHIVSSQSNGVGFAGPFLPLQAGDTGVRSIESVTMLTADVGLFTLVLVRPLAKAQIRGIDAPVEIDYFKDQVQIPEIKDDAFLNLLVHPVGSLSAVAIHGTIKTVWN